MASRILKLFGRKAAPDQVAETPVDATLARAQSLQKSGEFEAALRLYDELLAGGNNSDADIHYKRANSLNSLARWEAALAGYDRAVVLSPAFAKAFCNRGAVLEKLKRPEDALASYDRALALNAGDVLAYYNRGSVLKELKRFDEALASYEQAIAQRPDYAEAYVNRAHVLQELKRDQEALSSYDKAIAINDSYVEAFQGRGLSLYRLKRFEEAVSSYTRALALDPDQKYLQGLRRHIQMQICAWDGLTDDLQRLAIGLRAQQPVCTPFPVLALFDSPQLHRAAAEIWVREECPADLSLGVIERRAARDKVRIGYFSADFRSHAVAFLTVELFEMHDRSKFEIFAFAFGPPVNDPMRARLEKAFDRFIDVHERSHAEVAQLAREMGIDIAVDLGGFTEGSRTQIFALRAAPLQVSYIGYLGTMAAPYMDYLVADPTIIRPETRQYYSEKIIYLPSYQVNDSQRRISDRQFTRAELGLPPQGFVFCCLNGNYKITPPIFDIWMRVLRRVEGSTLFLSADNPVARRNLQRQAQNHGIGENRIIYGERLAVADYLARFRTMDLFLDTLPYNAGTTASDALWAGLPVLTCAGEGFPGRVAASLLVAIELPELIANSSAEYEEKAVSLATDLDSFAGVRGRLALNRQSAALFDTARFTHHLEAAYLQIHRRHQASLAPEDIVIADSGHALRTI